MRFALRILLVAASAVVSAAPARSQESPGKPPKGPEHKVLAQGTGHWEYTGTMYLADPKAEPMKLSGTAEVEFLGDTSWLILKDRGRANETPYESVGIMCYDSEKGRYTATMASTYAPPPLVIGEATYDEASRTFSWKEQEAVEPDTGKRFSSNRMKHLKPMISQYRPLISNAPERRISSSGTS